MRKCGEVHGLKSLNCGISGNNLIDTNEKTVLQQTQKKTPKLKCNEEVQKCKQGSSRVVFQEKGKVMVGVIDGQGYMRRLSFTEGRS